MNYPTWPPATLPKSAGFGEGWGRVGTELRLLQEESAKEMSALMPSILDKAFKGEL